MPDELFPSHPPALPHAPRLRVAAVMDTWIVSGPGRQITALARELQEQDIELRVFMFQRRGHPISPFIAYLQRAGVSYVVIPDNGPLDSALPGRLHRAFQAWKPDIVQSHGYRMTALVFLIGLAQRKLPWIAFFHGATNENWKMRLYNRLDRILMRRADRIVVLSNEHRSDFKDVSDRVRLIHNASITLPPEGDAVDLSPVRAAGKPIIAALARLSPEKGIDILMKAVARLSERGQPVSLVIAGDGPERAALEQEAQSLGIREYVHFLGSVKNVLSLYSQVDTVVLPSRAGAEGLPNVLLEALRLDVPVVATAVAAVPEVLANPLSGELVPPEDVDALVQSIQAALTNGKSPAASAARTEATARFSLERRVAAHLALYTEMRPDRMRSQHSTTSAIPLPAP